MLIHTKILCSQMIIIALINRHNAISITRWWWAKYPLMPHQYFYLRAGECYVTCYVLHM